MYNVITFWEAGVKLHFILGILLNDFKLSKRMRQKMQARKYGNKKTFMEYSFI